MKHAFQKLKQHKNQENKEAFLEMINEILPKLKQYIKHRINTYEAKGIFKKNFYSADGILSDVYLKIYDQFDRIENENRLKTEMFKIADEILENYAMHEKNPAEPVPVQQILKEELQIMNEDFTVNADGELILLEELDDISYKQDEFKPKIFLFDKNAEFRLANALGLSPEDFTDEKFRSLFGGFYAQIPETIRRIIDLYVFGELAPQEISLVTGLGDEDIELTLKTVREKLQRLK